MRYGNFISLLLAFFIPVFLLYSAAAVDTVATNSPSVVLLGLSAVSQSMLA